MLRSKKRVVAAQAGIDLDPYAYLSDVLERLPMHPAGHIAELLPHRWQPASTH